MLAWISQGQLPATGWHDGELQLLDVTAEVLAPAAPGAAAKGPSAKAP